MMQKQLVTLLIRYENNKNVPYITFFTNSGLIKCHLDFNNDTIFAFENMNVVLDQFTGTVIANINSQIKIWVSNFQIHHN